MTTPIPAETADDSHRYRPDPTVLTALTSPRLLTREVLAGLVVGLALIPEAIAFSIIAGVDPKVGLFSAFVMATSIAFLGGRPAMISAATGAVALVIAPVAREHGMDMFIATVMLAGIFQILLAVAGVAKLMRFIPRSVMVGFVNALSILVFAAQVPHVIGVPWMVYPLLAIGIVVLVFMPKLTKVVPAPLITIVVITGIVIVFAIDVPTVSDQGELPRSLPELFIPDIPLTWQTFTTIAPYSLAMALVGLMESLMTAKLVDEITDTHSNKTRESWGQGAANMISGLFGGMGGCAMIGQTMINVRASGARTRISTFMAGAFLLILVVVLGDIVGMIPMVALAAIMMMVCVDTFDWHSIRPSTLTMLPKSETFVMIATVAVVVATGNLAIGVVVGVFVASVLFVRRVAHFVTVERTVVAGAPDDQVDAESPVAPRDETGSASAEAVARYAVRGELFFASSNDLTTQFRYTHDPDRVVIDMSESHVWDASTVAALDAIVTKYEAMGTRVEITGMNAYTETLHARLSGGLG
ncbi:SulP family inorganic anion transporter [Brevibacterium sp. K11IcPPYGO002]|uniref:SulP family inorganic anion transporter n=1 Tax=Brevibacterium sp. K11IcPPYGO002 TaxID=3058837 RepID=UPI003D81AB95